MQRTTHFRTGAILFLLPALLLFAAFFLYPVGYVVVVSLMKWDGMSSPGFVGLRNYSALFQDEVFRISIRNNLIWACAEALIQVPLAILVALLLARKPKGWKLLRTIYFFPHVISGIAITMLWGAIYNNERGLLNGFLRLIGLSEWEHNWLGGLDSAFPSVLVYGLLYIGYFMVIILADISSVSQSYYEAASIDGATRTQQDWYITLPLIKGTIATCVTLAMVNGLRQFEQVLLLTNGGPANSTSVLVLYLYKELQNFHYGTANALGTVLIVLGGLIILTVRRLFNAAKYDM
ncbi:sugar ABC transporter permease [Paenibacillus sp. 7124]|uniref:Sugar ABC transporter permease n=1 Tax=Paenibacillus apii TaxID=1850370 RepID=A0A6M1PQV7_9BACL|nr:sugar ABC transporter permease [Paenibacillus apii]NGM85666.1 sugar ABC transporter permease [Paenibacillus apii]NJJ40449.1 sugar ABC transporter permease [Paenibacillus apii]